MFVGSHRFTPTLPAARPDTAPRPYAPRRAPQILKKHPAHGETLAFKSLIVSNYPERRQEAHDLAKAAIRADIKSHTCWHVYGLLHRADRDYPQAAKCYRQAMRIDPANLSICRDLCYIELQLRDTESLIATAEKVLRDKPNTRNHWMLLAVAHHLAGHHKVAVGVRNRSRMRAPARPAPAGPCAIPGLSCALTRKHRLCASRRRVWCGSRAAQGAREVLARGCRCCRRT